MTALATPTTLPAEITPIVLEVSWLVSRAALVSAGHAGPGVADGVVRWHVAHDHAAAELRIDGVARDLGRCRVAVERDGDDTHVTADGGVLFITATRGRVVYAHTNLLKTLGIPGGRYELVHPVTSGQSGSHHLHRV